MPFPISSCLSLAPKSLTWRYVSASTLPLNVHPFQDQEKLLEPLQFLPETKKREADATIRLIHVETLLLLCHTRWGRDYQRQHGVYQIIRSAHANETVENVRDFHPISPFALADTCKISGHLERLVQLIQGEEPNKSVEEQEEEELSTAPDFKDAVVEEKVADVDSDDEDLRIEEI